MNQPQQTRPFLSVVIPAYNEMKNLKAGALNEVINYLQQQKYGWEVILSDDGSSDGTTEKLADFAQNHNQVKLLKNPHRGKAPTVKAGMLNAQGEWRLFTDFDQSTPISELEKLLPFIEQGYEIIIGSREMEGSIRDEEPWYRHLMGRGFNILVQFLALPGIRDTQCGFKLLSTAATNELFSSLKIYNGQDERTDAFTGAFDVELLFLARRKGYQIAEVPIEWHHHETDRVDPIKDSLRMLLDIIRIRLAQLTGAYR